MNQRCGERASTLFLLGFFTLPSRYGERYAGYGLTLPNPVTSNACTPRKGYQRLHVRPLARSLPRPEQTRRCRRVALPVRPGARRVRDGTRGRDQHTEGRPFALVPAVRRGAISPSQPDDTGTRRGGPYPRSVEGVRDVRREIRRHRPTPLLLTQVLAVSATRPAKGTAAGMRLSGWFLTVHIRIRLGSPGGEALLGPAANDSAATGARRARRGDGHRLRGRAVVVVVPKRLTPSQTESGAAPGACVRRRPATCSPRLGRSGWARRCGGRWPSRTNRRTA